MKKDTIYKLIIAVLLVVNAVQLGGYFFGPKLNPNPKGEMFQERAIEILKLNAHQKSLFLDLAKKHQENLTELHQEQTKLTDSYFHQTSDSLLDAIGKLETKKINLTQKHFTEIKDILTQEQLPYFKTFKKEALQVILKENAPPKRGKP